VDVFCWLSNIVMEVVDIAGLCLRSVGQLKHLVGRLSCGDEGLLCAVLRGAYVGCFTAVGNGRWNGAVEDSLLDLVVERVTFGDVVDPLAWG
jgi:hypothetical protein